MLSRALKIVQDQVKWIVFPMPTDKIVIKGAREHNLKNVDLEIPKNKDLFALQYEKLYFALTEPCLLEGVLC